MADIGRSTAAHIDEEDIWQYPETSERLEEWGSWQSSIPGGGSVASPMFKDMKTGYRETKFYKTFVEEEAMECDRIIATFCSELEVTLLLYKFVYKSSARITASEIQSYKIEGRSLTHHQVLSILDRCIARIDMAYEVIKHNKTEVDLSDRNR